MAEIKKVLIANRGEIALRIIRSCKEMGIKTVAVYSEADTAAPHVLHADESVFIGKASPSESYLNIPVMIEAIKKSDADAVHPGYGFLSENANFAKICEQEGIRFIGPPASVIELMGDKTRARKRMAAAGVPCPPGIDSEVKEFAEAKEIATSVGYPVLIKAAAGGGGKGMRIINEPSELESGLKSARSEAKSAFNDDRVFIEKYLEEPRHIEFQIFADTQENTVHLFERECSVQRRYQKVIEEAPSPLLNDDLRQKMSRAAVLAAKSCGYVGAGTVEFLVDKHQNFYFLEMNTRLQVEHPVTEFITGLDLVALQIQIAEGKRLPFTQEEVKVTGHSIECRVYAEDPENNFLPDTGILNKHRVPGGPRVRVDAGIEEGQEVSIHYDPMISKLSVHASTRKKAIAKMIRALDEYEISGVKTTIPFCKFTLQSKEFTEGNYNTNFVKNVYTESQRINRTVSGSEMLLPALVSALLYETSETEITRTQSDDNGQKDLWWKQRT